MPYYDSPSFYIDFAQLPPPAVVETIDYQTLIARYRAQVVQANPALTKAVALEQSATNIILETEAYAEMILRARVNAAARAVMLAYARGTDLDHLGALYNVARMTNPDGSDELDDRFRTRVQLAPEAFSTAGTKGSYKFHALSADVSLTDASAIKVNAKGGVKVSLYNTAMSPTATDAQVTNVALRLNQDNIKVLTDVVSVASVDVLKTQVVGNLTLYPGPDPSIVLGNCQAALNALRGRTSRIGMSLTRASLITALNQEGVENVDLTSPSTDFQVDADQCVLMTSATLNVNPSRRF